MQSEISTKPFIIDTQEIKVAADVALLAYQAPDLYVLLVQRQYPPDEGKWALPGAFINNDEQLEDAVRRVIRDETGLTPPPFIEQVGTFGNVLRDPRRRVVSIAYLSLTNELGDVKGQLDTRTATKDAKWINLASVPRELAFDHEELLKAAIEDLRELITHTDAAKYLMPEKFTLTELQKLYEAVHGYELEKRNFRKSINQRDMLNILREMQTGNHRPARLHSFK